RRLGTEDLASFIQLEFGRIGADTNITPREVIRDFIELMDLMYQHPEKKLAELMESEDFSYAKSDAVSDQADANYVEFEL
ncbi:MAG: DUF2791 family P-loop domain-containing protein, partial [Clostridia bacterium]|nr:DUF2791 family P-loop domain-containing protein [Clostridia bacterium]